MAFACNAGPNRHAPHGVTLVELLVVVALLSLLLGVAAIPGDTEGDSALDLAGVQLQDAFTLAQTLAYSMGLPHGVVFDPVHDRFAVVAQGGTPAKDPLTHQDYVVDFRRQAQPRGLTIRSASFGTTGTAGIFDAQGAPLQAGTVTVGRGAASRTFVLDAATGKLE